MQAHQSNKMFDRSGGSKFRSNRFRWAHWATFHIERHIRTHACTKHNLQPIRIAFHHKFIQKHIHQSTFLHNYIYFMIIQLTTQNFSTAQKQLNSQQSFTHRCTQYFYFFYKNETSAVMNQKNKDSNQHQCAQKRDKTTNSAHTNIYNLPRLFAVVRCCCYCLFCFYSQPLEQTSMFLQRFFFLFHKPLLYMQSEIFFSIHVILYVFSALHIHQFIFYTA